ncbi:retropepsin-like aspartic protease [Luteibacter yeojuensis]|nr:retropepsin-like aspartic protease [Luteibacter yeojuensis]
MSSMKHAVWVATCLYLVVFDASAVQIKYVSPARASPLVQAALQGNDAVLDAYAERNPYPVLKAFAAATAARARYDLVASETKAAECYGLAKSSQPAEMNTLMACGELHVGNALLAGRFKDWTIEAAHARRDLYPLLPKVAGVELRDAALESPDAAAFAQWPAPTYDRSKTGGILKATGPALSGFTGLISVKARANGVELTLLVDTGTQMTVLSREDAKRVNARQSSETVMEVAPSQVAKSVAVKAALLGSLNLGAFRVGDANIGVWDQPFSVLGMDILRQLPGPLRLSRQALAFGGPTLPSTCTGRIALHSELGARPAQIFLTGTVDGIAKEFMVDTGNNGGVTRRALPGEAPGKSIDVMSVAGPTEVKSSITSQSVGLGHTAMTEQVRVVTGDMAADYILGAGVLSAERTLWLSFDDQRGCVLPTEAAE